MVKDHHEHSVSAIFITFSGNCKKALTFYQKCFGGVLRFETFDKQLEGFKEMPVISGSLVSPRVIIHGSDLVHNEGRQLGNYMAIYLASKNSYDREELINKLSVGKNNRNERIENQKLIEVIDAFDVRWVLGI